MAKRPKVPPTRQGPPPAFLWPCGCVTIGSRQGTLEADCGKGADCYRLHGPTVRRVHPLRLNRPLK